MAFLYPTTFCHSHCNYARRALFSKGLVKKTTTFFNSWVTIAFSSSLLCIANSCSGALQSQDTSLKHDFCNPRHTSGDMNSNVNLVGHRCHFAMSQCPIKEYAIKVWMYSSLDGVEWLASHYGRFNLYPLNRGLGGSTSRPRRKEFIASAGK